MDEIEVTQADRDSWEQYGPLIFHGDMTGPYLIATIREAAIKALDAHRIAGADGVAAKLNAEDCNRGRYDREASNLILSQKAEIGRVAAERDALRVANGILEDALQEVGDDYPGSSCQEWCHEQVKTAREALGGGK